MSLRIVFFTMELYTAVEAGKWYFTPGAARTEKTSPLSTNAGWRIFGPYDTELKSLIAAAEIRQSSSVHVFYASDAAHYETMQDMIAPICPKSMIPRTCPK